MEEVVVCGAARTPLGAFGGALSALSAPQLGAEAIRAALERANVPPAAVEEVYFGNVLGTCVGQAPARQAALLAGLPESVPCTTVNKVCASGMKATALAAMAIMCGQRSVVVAGGMESMSSVPYALPKARTGYRMGHQEVVDTMIKDGLWCASTNVHMGECAERTADEHGFSREAQDGHAVRSCERAVAAQKAGMFAAEITPVSVPGGRGKPAVVVDADEAIAKINTDKLRALKPVFRPGSGTVTAGNASPISDGGAALVLASASKARELGLPVLARIRGFGDHALTPEKFTVAPTGAVHKALAHAGLQLQQVDYFELNEAFSVVDLANAKLLGVPAERVNVLGGAVALGHPIGCSGARILVTLLNVLRLKGARVGVAGICNGGGGASAMVLELVS